MPTPTHPGAVDIAAVDASNGPVVGPLTGVRVVTLAPNLPGPAAAHRLRSLGAMVVKIEPPTGDPLATAAPGYYRELVSGQRVQVLDLKEEPGRQELTALLQEADLLLTSSRPQALARLGLSWVSLQLAHPRLCQVAIVGHGGDLAGRPGHDLTYQAEAGTLCPPQLPVLPVADLAGAERVVGDAIAALFQASRTGEGVYREVSLSQVMRDFSASVRHNLSAPGAVLGGALPTYGLYPAAEGCIALAALEPHFIARLGADLEVDPMDRAALEKVFATRSAEAWARWAEERDLPLVEVVGA